MTSEHNRLVKLVTGKRYFKKDYDTAVLRLVYDYKKDCTCLLIEFYRDDNLIRQARFRQKKWVSAAEIALSSPAAKKTRVTGVGFSKNLVLYDLTICMTLIIELIKIDGDCYSKSFYHPIYRTDTDMSEFLGRISEIKRRN